MFRCPGRVVPHQDQGHKHRPVPVADVIAGVLIRVDGVSGKVAAWNMRESVRTGGFAPGHRTTSGPDWTLSFWFRRVMMGSALLNNIYLFKEEINFCFSRWATSHNMSVLWDVARVEEEVPN